MTKAELIEKIIDAMVDPYTDCPEDYLYSTPIDTCEATDLLCQIRSDEKDMELDPEERLPQEVTPALVKEAYNCLIRARKHEARVEQLAEYITDNEMVCEYANFYLPELENGIDMIPVDFLSDTDGFQFIDNASPLDIMRIAVNSQHVFNPNDEYCWFDKEHMILHSTNRPFRDGILDAKAFAEYAMSDEGQDCLDYILSDMTDEEITNQFGCTRKEMFI